MTHLDRLVEEVTYRVGDLDDAQAVAVIAATVRGQDTAGWVERVHRGLSRPGNDLVLACGRGHIIGYGKAGPCRSVGPDDPAPAGYYLNGLAVLPAWRRRGIATELTRRRLHQAWATGQAAWSFTNAGNVASLSLHARLGFREVGRAASYLGVDFDGDIGVLLRADTPGRGGWPLQGGSSRHDHQEVAVMKMLEP